MRPKLSAYLETNKSDGHDETDKSAAVLVSTVQRAKEFSSLRTVSTADSSVKVASQIRLLGVTLDANLNFNAQIKNIFHKL